MSADFAGGRTRTDVLLSIACPAGFAELHCHSNFSFLDGASSVEDLAERAVGLGLSALALTDHQGLYGAVRFATAAQDVGLRPIVGMEIELLDAIAPDPGGLIVPRRRRQAAASNGRDRPSEWSTEASGRPSRFAAVLPEEPAMSGRAGDIERLRPPGHREPRREDLRGVTDARAWARTWSCSRAT